MDISAFGLKFRPFASVPDPAGYFPAPAHDDVLAQITAALLDDEPCAVLAGGPGLGKTLLAHLAVRQLDEPAVAFVTNPRCERRADLYQALLFDFGVAYAGRSEQELRLAFTDYAFGQHRAGRRVLVVLDEAHLLSPDLLEEVRLLGNLETPRGRAVQFLLAGCLPLLDTMDQPELHGLAQRVTTRAILEPMTLRESAEYLVHHLSRSSGRSEPVFTNEAIEELAKGCHGIPRILNQAAHAAMGLALKAELTTVDIEAAMLAVEGLPHAAVTEEPAEEPPQIYHDEEDVVAPESNAEVEGKSEVTIPWVQEPVDVSGQRFVFSPVIPS